ncbi:hypothetical protein SBOR_1532 [Sclerotinia borealis F-4128]|uniref:White collar-2 n=1 Tax=Sclerotinia borealis (strain F-4128) TaxID=1432307 RepID=W9CQF1_SCLBF|nr:hypothetical protein SBOR_1532 [Sclerotinia borealis F-4128]
MSEGDTSMNMNNLALDPAAIMYHNHADNLGSTSSASQADQNLPDALMTEMLQDNLMIDYDNLPDLNINMNALDDNGNMPESFTPISNLMSPTENEQGDGIGRLGMNTEDAQMGEIGAGPLPTGFGAQPSLPGSSTFTDFTKRRNWPQKVVEEIKDFLHVLTPTGKFVYASPSCQSLTGYAPEELSGKYIVDFIHPDDSALYIREFNEAIASGNSLRFFYRFRKKDLQTFAIFDSKGHAHYASATAPSTPHLSLRDTSDYCRGVFMMARPYPTANAVLLDSFLEHKIEFERMTKRIEALRREEQDEDEGERQLTHKQSPESSGTITTSMSASIAVVPSHSDFMSMPPSARPDMSHSALTRANLEDASSSRKSDSINDKMLRFGGADRIEMLTGLQYREGERSQGISTGDHNPALIKGDAGIVIPFDKDGRSGDKKKKLKLVEEYVCTDCGTTESPEWRKGPYGPKTLCNACGLRWAKKEKKEKKQNPDPPSNLPIGV